MKTILCFGDSNTWGYVPGSDAERFAPELRWPRRLAAALGDEWDVIAEGLSGRTATVDSPIAEGRNGLTYLLPCLHSHMPVDVVVIYLGTNDAGDRYSLPAENVGQIQNFLASHPAFSLVPMAGVWKDAIEDEHIWTSPLLDMRFGYRPENPLYLLLVRAFRLPDPATVENTPAYAGCKSWVPLEEPISTAGATPALDDASYAKRVEAIKAIMAS